MQHQVRCGRRLCCALPQEVARKLGITRNEQHEVMDDFLATRLATAAGQCDDLTSAKHDVSSFDILSVRDNQYIADMNAKVKSTSFSSQERPLNALQKHD